MCLAHSITETQKLLHKKAVCRINLSDITSIVPMCLTGFCKFLYQALAFKYFPLKVKFLTGKHFNQQFQRAP